MKKGWPAQVAILLSHVRKMLWDIVSVKIYSHVISEFLTHRSVHRNAWSRATNQDDGCAAPCFMIVRHHPTRTNGFANFRCCLRHNYFELCAPFFPPFRACMTEWSAVRTSTGSYSGAST